MGIEAYKEGNIGLSESFSRVVPSDLVSELFSNQKNIGSLIKRGRDPVRMGRIGSPDSSWKIVYAVPPVNLKPEDIADVAVDCGGASFFTSKGGKRYPALTYRVSAEKAEEVDRGIEEALKKRDFQQTQQT
jgi:hypothetical protein